MGAPEADGMHGPGSQASLSSCSWAMLDSPAACRCLARCLAGSSAPCLASAGQLLGESCLCGSGISPVVCSRPEEVGRRHLVPL